jgi:acyl-CoA synthetase (AMP-forming)/AMP-acid ligase II
MQCSLPCLAWCAEPSRMTCRFHRYDLSSLRTGIMAGAPCPVALMQKVQSRGSGCRGWCRCWLAGSLLNCKVQ